MTTIRVAGGKTTKNVSLARIALLSYYYLVHCHFHRNRDTHDLSVFSDFGFTVRNCPTNDRKSVCYMF